MKEIFCAVLASMVLIITNQNVYSQAGQLDSTFGDGGIVMYDLSGGLHETAWDMEILEDSTILLCGTINNGNVGITDGFLLKLKIDGTIEESWGNNGLVTFDLGEDTYAYKLDIVSNEKIVVGGTVYVTPSNSEFFAARFNPDGSPDTDFGDNGVFISSKSSTEDECYTMAVQEDGKIVLAGATGYANSQNMMFVRTNSDGNIDLTFGVNGYALVNSSTSNENIRGIDFLSSGNIIGVGYTYWSDPEWCELASIVQLDEDGNPVTQFGNNGVLIPAWADSYSYALDVEIHDDAIYLTGWKQETDNDVFLAKLDADGVFDPLFGNNGLALFDLNIIDQAFDVYWGPDQKIYLCGNTGAPGAGGSKEFLLIRYMPDGTLDTSLNNSGHVETEIRIDSDAPFSVKLQADGKIVLAGMSSGLSTTQKNNVAAVRYLNDYSTLNADFVASATTICEGESISFTDLSTGNITSWEWYFEGGNPEFSNDQNPTVIYNTAGLYDVQLIISNGAFSDSLLVEELILVEDCVGVEDYLDKNVKIYPNPANQGQINIDFNMPELIKDISLINSRGQILTAKNLTGQSSKLDISELTKGLYYVKINYKNGLTQTKKIFIN